MADELVVFPSLVGDRRLSAEVVHPAGDSHTVVTEANVDLDGSATPWLPATLPVAMRTRRSLRIHGDVDGVALRNVSPAQQVLSGWYPRILREISVHARSTVPGTTPADGVGCFFSGGVDSFYSALNHSSRITHLIFVTGFDIAVDNTALTEKALAAARQAAADLGKPLIEVTTGIRRPFSDVPRIDWGAIYHGPALAHVALALAPHLGSVIIPSSYSSAQLHPWGSHPALDPWWSSRAVSIEHDRTDVGRMAKIAAIARSTTAMRHLRVCWRNTNGEFNCGRCSKCIRTRLALQIANGDCATLPGRVDPDLIRGLHVDRTEQLFFREILAALPPGTEEPLRRAVVAAMRRGRLRSPFR